MDEIQELAKVLLIERVGYTEEELDELYDEDEMEFNYLFYEHFNIIFEDFEELVPKLAKLIDIGKGVSGNLYKGFGKDNRWLYKIKIKENEA